MQLELHCLHHQAFLDSRIRQTAAKRFAKLDVRRQLGRGRRACSAAADESLTWFTALNGEHSMAFMTTALGEWVLYELEAS